MSLINFSFRFRSRFSSTAVHPIVTFTTDAEKSLFYALQNLECLWSENKLQLNVQMVSKTEKSTRFLGQHMSDVLLMSWFRIYFSHTVWIEPHRKVVWKYTYDRSWRDLQQSIVRSIKMAIQNNYVCLTSSIKHFRLWWHLIEEKQWHLSGTLIINNRPWRTKHSKLIIDWSFHWEKTRRTKHTFDDWLRIESITNSINNRNGLKISDWYTVTFLSFRHLCILPWCAFACI